MAISFLEEAELKDKKVIARFDFNVPIDTETGKILDTTRIDLAIPTIKYLLEHNVKKLVLVSHLGRPKGKRDEKYSLAPIADYLSQAIDTDITLTESAKDSGIKTLLEIASNKVILLENIRFHKEETDNSRDFAQKLASYGDLFVNDAFGTCHRKHSSTYQINTFFKNKSYAGLLLQKEITALNHVVKNPRTPFYAIVGGAKVSDKIKIINKLLPNVQKLFIGGAMAYPFLKAKGQEIGKSLCHDEDVELALEILRNNLAQKLVLPIDHLVASSPNDKIPEAVHTIPNDLMALDIGPKTITMFKNELADAKTILWNGPMGFFEKEAFSKGTFSIATTLSKLQNCFTLVGGGDSVSAVNKSGIAKQISHISTGGGASLEYIENGTLPGIEALKYGIN